jgi:hypothetical protein
MLGSRLAYYLTLKIEEIYSSETSVDFNQIAWYYTTEDRILQVLVFGLTFLSGLRPTLE